MKNIFEIYKDYEKRSACVVTLITCGKDIFYQAHIIKEFNEFKSLVPRLRYVEPYKIEPADLYKIAAFIMDDLIDCVRIITFFENYFKAILLKKGFIVHEFKEQELLKKLKVAPLRIDDYLNNAIIEDILKTQTIGFSVLIEKKDYVSALDIDEEIIAILKEINSKRNELHLYKEQNSVFSYKRIKNLERLKDFVDKTT